MPSLLLSIEHGAGGGTIPQLPGQRCEGWGGGGPGGRENRKNSEGKIGLEMCSALKNFSSDAGWRGVALWANYTTLWKTVWTHSTILALIWKQFHTQCTHTHTASLMHSRKAQCAQTHTAGTTHHRPSFEWLALGSPIHLTPPPAAKWYATEDQFKFPGDSKNSPTLLCSIFWPLRFAS